MLLCHTVLPVLSLGKNCLKWLENRPKWRKNRQIMQKPYKKKHGRKTGKIWRIRGKLTMFCFCTFKISNSFLPNCQFQIFCDIFLAGGVKAPPPPPQKRLCKWVDKSFYSETFSPRRIKLERQLKSFDLRKIYWTGNQSEMIQPFNNISI